jgi:hypothetical protein
VANLFDLANKALGGETTGGASLSEINDAVSAINEGFDGCRFLTEFNDQSNFKLALISSISNNTEELSIKAFPNPFASSTTIQFVSSTNAYVSINVYDKLGAKVATPFTGNINANEKQQVIFNSNDKLANGIYFFVITSGDKSSGDMLILSR